MTKNLLMIVAFVAVLLGGLFLLGPKEVAEAPRKAEIIVVDSSMKDGRVLFRTYPDRPAIPDVMIKDEAGNDMTLNDIVAQNPGQTLLVNFWATWCFPCREEMPDLDSLQAARGGDDFRVVLISVDRGGLKPSRMFLDKIGVKNLDLYYDEKGILGTKMKTIGYPTTILINKKGRQMGLMTGSAHWNSTSANALIDRLIVDE
ncbi:MAG: TlpA family protein disulfide reductase [Emcibacter sp.]|nr:TlpA family protein disulfide reductase [Emcibacter sp.]HEC00092.1 TlpA family protein disulfide reductase [Sphingomonadales bacterium]